MIALVERAYVSRHVYQTPSGAYYDDRKGIRISRSRGESAQRSSERMAYRFRDDSGRFETRLFEVKYDAATGTSRVVSVYGTDVSGPQALVPVAYNPNTTPRLSEDQARRWLDENEPGVRHFRITIGDATSGQEDYGE